MFDWDNLIFDNSSSTITMHYEYQHAGLERSQPHESEQNLIKGMDVRTALDRSGYGNKSNVEKSQKFNDV